jgi:hypothetical protein
LMAEKKTEAASTTNSVEHIEAPQLETQPAASTTTTNQP